jgi:anti-sigma-K factor RskA/putative zinc finger protein
VSRDVSHSEAMELLSEAALDALPPDDQAGVVAHATGCPECGPALIALRDAVAQMAFAAPPVTVDPVRRARVRTRLMARARADLSVADTPSVAGELADAPGGARDSARGGTGQGPRVIAGRGGPSPSGGPRRSWGMVAALGWGLAIAAGLALVAVQRRAASDERFFTTERRVLLARVDALRDSVESRDAFVRSVTGHHISSLQLTSGAVRAPWAWMFWDHATNTWTLVARDLPLPAPGRTYQLWLVTRKAKISAGTFSPRPDGAAEVQATYALAADALTAIAVTDEPAGGVPQPTGALVISATANRPGK